MHSPPRAPSGTLTSQELEAAQVARYDLGPGYPQIPLESYARQLYLADTLQETSLSFAPWWTPEKQLEVDSQLMKAVASLLNLSPDAHHAIRATFSGSVALDRALTAVLNEARKEGSAGLDVITTSPSIDIMRLFLAERQDISAFFVESESGIGALDVSALISRLERLTMERSAVSKLVLLTSPENPTGAFWSATDLATIAKACWTLGATLLVDHSFLVAGVQEEAIPRLWDVATNYDNWLVTWDTGKTFGLNEDKLGFIVTGGPGVTQALDESLSVMQFGVARRLKVFFAMLIESARLRDHVGMLRSICQENLDYLQDRTQKAVVRVSPVKAGSFALLDCEQTGNSDEELRRRLLENGVGVVAGNVFFHGDRKPTHYLRVALARDPAHFRSAIDALTRSL